jgi:hypothetical protein
VTLETVRLIATVFVERLLQEKHRMSCGLFSLSQESHSYINTYPPFQGLDFWDLGVSWPDKSALFALLDLVCCGLFASALIQL